MTMRPRADILNIGFFDWQGERLLTGGAERYVSDLCGLLLDAGYRPRLIQNAHAPFTREYRGIEVVGVAAADQFDLPKLAAAFGPLTADAALVIASPVELAAQIPAGPAVVGINHGIWWDHPDHRAAWFDVARHDTLLAALRRTTTCVCVDTNFINWLRTFDGESLDRLEYVPNYVDLAQFGPRDKDFSTPRLTVLYPRRLCNERGIAQVFACFDDLFSQDQPFELHLCGGGSAAEVERARDFVARYPGRARWTEAPMVDMPAVYAQSHIVVIPTLYSEGTSLACLEAMATRNGVIATHVGGLPNLVLDRMNGLLIKPGTHSLAQALRRLADDRELLAALAARAVETSRAFGLEAWKVRWREVLQRVGAPAAVPGTGRDPASASPAIAPARPPMRPACCALVPGLVSVVLPVYNGVSMLDYAIRSVLAQTYRPFELIIVDDGSTDGADAVLARYSGRPEIRIVVQPNQRLPRALSHGFAHARGEFWTWTSADNLMGPRQLERLVGRLRADPGIAMTYADYRVIDDRGNPLGDRSWRAHNRPAPATGEVRLPRATDRLNAIPDNFIGPCFLYRGWIGRLLGDYAEEQGIEDYDYWMRINALFSIRHLESAELLYWYRVHADALSTHLRDRPIVEKVDALMRTEADRSAYFAQTPVLYADTDAMQWLAARDITAGVRAPGLVPRDAVDSVPGAIVALASAQAMSLPGEAGVTIPLVLIFGRGGRSPYETTSLLGRPAVLAVVTHADDAARVRGLAPVPIVDGEAADLRAALAAFARDSGFRMRANPIAHAAQPPIPFVDASGVPRLALATERLAVGPDGESALAAAAVLRSSGFAVTVLAHDASEEAIGRARHLGVQINTGVDQGAELAYRAWLREHHIDLVVALGMGRGAVTAASIGIPVIQWLRPPVDLSAEAVAHFRAADAATTAYACDSVAVAQVADLALGLDPRKFGMVGNRLSDEGAGHGDCAHALARLAHAVLRR